MGLAYSGVTGVGWGADSGVGSGVGSGRPTAPIAYFMLRRVARQRATPSSIGRAMSIRSLNVAFLIACSFYVVTHYLYIGVTIA